MLECSVVAGGGGVTLQVLGGCLFLIPRSAEGAKFQLGTERSFSY